MKALHVEAEAASPKHRTAIIKQSLALGAYKTLENFRAACLYWRSHVSRGSSILALNRPVVSQGPAYTLDQFSHAYNIAQTTKIHRAVLDILYRADLAHLYDVYVGTLNTLSGYTAQHEKISNWVWQTSLEKSYPPSSSHSTASGNYCILHLCSNRPPPNTRPEILISFSVFSILNSCQQATLLRRIILL